MDPKKRCIELPVLFLYNVDRSWARSEVEEALRGAVEIREGLCGLGHPVTEVPVYGPGLENLLAGFDPGRYVVFNWCEEIPGSPNSDALVAGLLEEFNFTYTGSPPDVLALSWDKPRVKRLLRQRRVPTPRWRIYKTNRVNGWDCFPAIVKPALEHCSIGVTPEAVVLGPAELRDRIAYVLDEFNQPALVEDFIDGREFHVTLWGDSRVGMLPPAEMDFAAFDNVRERLCTFESKFVPDSVHYNRIELRLPAPLDSESCRLLEKTAWAAYKAVGCRDYARIDIRLRNGVFYVLDVNPNPDISSQTSMASAAQLAGFSYGAMISNLVRLAALRHPIFGSRVHRKKDLISGIER